MGIIPKFNIESKEFKELPTSRGIKKMIQSGIWTLVSFLTITPIVEVPLSNLIIAIVPGLNSITLKPLITIFISGVVGYAVSSVID